MAAEYTALSYGNRFGRRGRIKILNGPDKEWASSLFRHLVLAIGVTGGFLLDNGTFLPIESRLSYLFRFH